MILQSSRRAFWTVGRHMGPHEWYVDNRESHHYGTKEAAQIDADARNVILATSIAAGNPVMNPTASFIAVKVNYSETVETE